MPVTYQRHYRHLEQLAELAQRLRQHGSGAAQRIARLGIYYGDVSVLNGLAQLAHQADVGGKLALADATHLLQQPLAADESVDRHNIGRPLGEYRLGGHLEVQEGIVVAQQHVWWLDALHPDLGDLGLVLYHVGETQQQGYGP